MDEASLGRAAHAIANAHALLITAGAGMGVDSGLPDFRGPEGFWKAYPAYRHLGLGFAQLANPRWFQDDPALAWGF
ncbi:MAG TPA: NAD-dependent protein deacetylase, partial [Phycisphaerae bacterium]|nr:NAD-dependent protein deacetylase [Phycisphaerae bacterium]